MERLPVIRGGRPFFSRGRSGTAFANRPARGLSALARREIEEVERRFARGWRRMLSQLDLNSVYQHVRRLGGGEVRVRTLQEAKAWSEKFVRGDGRRYTTLRAACELLDVPDELVPRIIARWKDAGGPALPDFAPYAAHLLRIDLFFLLALGADLISKSRASNRIDMAYLYYLPFCMVFVSNDGLHARTAPLFLRGDQIFIKGKDLKRDLRRLDEHYSKLPEEIRNRGVISFATSPPTDGQYLTTELWRRFLPRWPVHPEPRSAKSGGTKVPPWLWDMVNAAKSAEQGYSSADDADFVLIERRVPTRMGKWRLLPSEGSK